MSWLGSSPTREVDHDHPQRHADLRRGQPDPGRRVHRLDHVREERADVVVDLAPPGVRERAARRRRTSRSGGWAWAPIMDRRRGTGSARAGEAALCGARRLEVRQKLGERVAARLLEQRVRRARGQHRLGHDAGGGHDAGVAALDRGLLRLLACAGPPSAAATSSVGIGLTTARARSSSPLVMPALEPAGAVRRPCEPALRVPQDLVVERGAAASRRPRSRRRSTPPSRRGSTSAPARCGRRGGGPTARTRRARRARRAPRPRRRRPGCRRPSWRGRSRATIASARAASAQRTGLASTAARSSHATHAIRERGASPIRTTWLRTSAPTSRSSDFASAPAATRAVVSRALARSSTFLRSSVPYFRRSGEVGVARARMLQPAGARGRRRAEARGTSRPSSSRGPCCGSGARPGCRACARAARRTAPRRRRFSIFMRPPRP